MIKQYLEYLKDNPQGYWFRARWFGWGWVPAKWQGWLAILLYVAALAWLFKRAGASAHSASDTALGFSLPIILLTAVLLFICSLKGEKPSWNWGDPRKKR